MLILNKITRLLGWNFNVACSHLNGRLVLRRGMCPNVRDKGPGKSSDEEKPAIISYNTHTAIRCSW